MFAGFYTLGSGVLTQQRNLDIIGNNITNSQTPGYRAERLEISAFEKEMLSRTTASGIRQFGSGTPTAVVGDLYQTMNAGLIQNTERNMDIALDGPGFFNVQSAQDDSVTYLTRNGQFDVDEQGRLILPGYGFVLDDSGNQITLENTNFTVGRNGMIYDSEGEEVAALGVTVPQTDTDLLKLDNGMFTLANGANAVPAEGYHTVQGSLERSNVDLNNEMSKLIETQRAFQLASSAMQIVDRINQSATDIASV